MIVSIEHGDWQVLRALARAGGESLPGWKMRVRPTRVTKSGEFLTALVAEGLIVQTDEPPVPPDAAAQVTHAVRRAGPFHFRYKLTALGCHAAEYGEYDRPPSPQPRTDREPE